MSHTPRIDRPSFDVDRQIGRPDLKDLTARLIAHYTRKRDPDPEKRARLDIEGLFADAFDHLARHYSSHKKGALEKLLKLQKEALDFYDLVLAAAGDVDVGRLEKIFRDMEHNFRELARKADDLAGDMPTRAVTQPAAEPPAVKPPAVKQRPPKQSAKIPDPKRHIKAQKAKEALEAESTAATAAFRESADEISRLEADLRKLTDNPVPPPPELRKAREALQRIDDLEDRLDAIKALEAQPGHSQAAADYLRWRREVMSIEFELDDIKGGNRAAGELAATRTKVDEPKAEAELRAASRPVKALLRSTGPNYRKASQVTHDQILEPERWSKLAEELTPDQRKLATDHLVPLDEIGNMPELAPFLALYERAPVDVQDAMTRALIDIGDRPDNLVRMRADANGSALKGSRSWEKITYGEAKEFGYDAPDVRRMRAREADAKREILAEIERLIRDYERIIGGT